MNSDRSTVVERLPHHSKVKGWSMAGKGVRKFQKVS